MAIKNKTYIISVSLKAGCYRHIKVSSDILLSDLSMEILDAFEFLDSHAHAFFMDNIAWSQKKAYYVDYIEDASHYSKDFTVRQVIKDKQKFKYVFDFGTEWVFQCRVLKILDEPYTEEYGEVIRSKGEAPDQYGFDFDDEDFDFGFDDEE